MSVINIDISDFVNIKDKFKTITNEILQSVDEVLDSNAIAIASKAKTLAPKDMGLLAGSISADLSRPLDKRVTVNANYGPFVEFGTGKYAAAYVATLPATWREYAARFKGKTGGGLDAMFLAILEWVKRKGIIGLTKSGSRRKGKKADAEAYDVAYVITIAILRNGIHPHPFLFPAYDQQRKQIITDLQAVIAKFTK